MSFMQAKERLYLTTDRKELVREGDPAAATLYAGPGDEIPESAVQLFGLVDGTLGKGGKGSGDKGGTKEQKPGQDKEQKPGEDKGAGGGTKGATATPPVATETPAGDDLTKVRGIGPSSANGFIAAGFTTFAQLAAIDPANPPSIAGLGVRTNWETLTASAAELVAPAADNGQGGGAASGDAGAKAGATDQQAN